jgi:DNA-binding CsgD family transcriptional regulator
MAIAQPRRMDLRGEELASWTHLDEVHSDEASTVASPDEVWASLREGRASILWTGGGALIVANPPAVHAARALTDREARALEQLAQGSQCKAIAADLGLSPSQLSRLLAGAAGKLGCASSFEAVRTLGRLFTRREGQAHEGLTAAEREVLELVRRGLSNKAIATLRGRSERTIANQVAALLRKSGLPGRRALAARLS